MTKLEEVVKVDIDSVESVKAVWFRKLTEQFVSVIIRQNKKADGSAEMFFVNIDSNKLNSKL